MVLLAGPNGAGKSTLCATRVAPSFAGPFINADIIQRDELCDPSLEASYQAARIAAERRVEFWLKAGISSPKPSFRIPPSLISSGGQGPRFHRDRHACRGRDGGTFRVARRCPHAGRRHDVPEDKIRARYERGAPLIRAAVLKADRGMVFDNSSLNQPPSLCLTFSSGRLFAKPHLPGWIRTAYQADLTF
jgi:predicted ABC-type ATPase